MPSPQSLSVERSEIQQRNISVLDSLSSPYAICIFLILSLPLIFILAPGILPPRYHSDPIPDDPDDLSLFTRASQSSSSSSSSSSVFHLSSGRPKIAFLFLTNSDLYFAPLWEHFFSGNQLRYNIYVHPDPSSPLPSLPGVFSNRSITSRPTRRASPTLISAARRLLATALLDDSSNAFFALISQYCIPLHSFSFVYRVLFSPPPWAKSEPFPSYIEIKSKKKNLWDRYVARGRSVMLPEVSFSQFRVGSQFFVLNRRHALMVIRDRKLWRKFRLPCYRAYMCFPEEHYFPTLLSMEDPDGCSHFTLTRVNWTGSVHGHPHVYSREEVSEQLIRHLRRSNSTYSYLFARKFSPQCLDKLMAMAGTVILKD